MASLCLPSQQRPVLSHHTKGNQQGIAKLSINALDRSLQHCSSSCSVPATVDSSSSRLDRIHPYLQRLAFDTTSPKPGTTDITVFRQIWVQARSTICVGKALAYMHPSHMSLVIGYTVVFELRSCRRSQGAESILFIRACGHVTIFQPPNPFSLSSQASVDSSIHHYMRCNEEVCSQKVQEYGTPNVL